MYPRRMMIAGVILMLAAAGVFAFAFLMIGDEEAAMKKAVRFDGSAAGSVKQGDLVLVEGRVSVKNKILVHDFVHGAKENNDAGTWGILEAYRQPIIADLAQGEITLVSELICSEAKGNNTLETEDRTPNNDPIRFQGLRRGDPITAVGTLSALAPAALAVQSWYSGSSADYSDYLASNRSNLYIFCPLIALAGAGLFLVGFRKR